jgi:hypothetical protein
LKIERIKAGLNKKPVVEKKQEKAWFKNKEVAPPVPTEQELKFKKESELISKFYQDNIA